MEEEKINRLRKSLEDYNNNKLPSEIKFLGENDAGEREYETIQTYPHLLKFHNPFTFEQIWVLIEKDDDGNIVKSRINFL